MTDQLSPLDQALRFAALGWKLFPAKWNGGHRGLVLWGTESTNDLNTIRHWGLQWPDCYFCVATHQSGLTVLDIDNKKGNNGSASLIDLELQNTCLPETITVKTPSDGFHHIFIGSTPVTVGKLGKGIDTPVMVPLPGSVIPGKGDYTLVTDVKVLPAALPAWVARVIGEKKAQSERLSSAERDNPNIDLDTPLSVSHAIAYLSDPNRAPISVEGDGGDLTAFQVACVVRDYGISPEKTLELMLDHWNERCDGPWDVDELNKKVLNAYRYAQKPIGSTSAQSEFGPIDEEGNSVEKGEGAVSKPIPISRFVGNPPPRTWVVQDWLPHQEVSGLYGKGGLGKSLLALQLGLNVSSGETSDFMGAKIDKPMKVLYVTCEDREDEAHRRVHGIMSSPGYEFMSYRAPMYVWPRVGESSILAYQNGSVLEYGLFYAELCSAVEEYIQDGLLILDTISDIFAVNENERQIASQCIKTILGGIIKKYGCTIFVVAHPSKAGEASGSYDSGSTGWRNSFRCMWALKEHEDKELKDYRHLMRPKSNYSGVADPLLLQWEKGRLKNMTGVPIINDAMEYNTEIVYEAIRGQCEKGQRLGVHHSHSPNLYVISLKDKAGNEISKKAREHIKDKLILDGRILEIRNTPRKNGLWTTEQFNLGGQQ